VSNISTRDRRLRVSSPESAYDFRILVEGLHSDDLAMASDAYERMVDAAPATIARACDDPLTRIGVSLEHGDLMAARRTLDGLEDKALQLLHGLKAKTRSSPERRGKAAPALN